MDPADALALVDALRDLAALLSLPFVARRRARAILCVALALAERLGLQ